MGTMTKEAVLARVQRVSDMRGDDEAAHSEEDRLHLDVLQAIADGAENAAELAAAALQTTKIEFSRWSA